MPYYRWHGVDIIGDIKKGVQFARDPQHLDAMLITREIALLSHKPQRQWMRKPIRMKDRLQFFRQLAVLINAGVLLPDAIGIVGDQLDHPPFQELIHSIATDVREGMLFSTALENYCAIFDPITIQLIRAGEESGNMGYALDAIASHMAATQDFYRRLRTALFLPAITMIFFCTIALIIFVFIMPRFLTIFSSLQQEMPLLTKRLLAMSLFIRSPLMGIVTAIGGAMILGVWRLTRVGKGRRILDNCLLHMPIIGSIMQQRFIGYTMQTLAVLLQGGMPLKQAISVVGQSVHNNLCKEQLVLLEGQIAAGSSLSDAIIRQQGMMGAPDVIAMIEVGQESGRLSMLLARVGHTYYERVTQQLSRLTMLLQPAVMVILGLLVALLIFAVYGPIFTLSSGF